MHARDLAEGLGYADDGEEHFDDSEGDDGGSDAEDDAPDDSVAAKGSASSGGKLFSKGAAPGRSAGSLLGRNTLHSLAKEVSQPRHGEPLSVPSFV